MPNVTFAKMIQASFRCAIFAAIAGYSYVLLRERGVHYCV